MYICNKFGCFLLLICLISIWLLDHPEELRKVEKNYFSSPTTATAKTSGSFSTVIYFHIKILMKTQKETQTNKHFEIWKYEW